MGAYSRRSRGRMRYVAEVTHGIQKRLTGHVGCKQTDLGYMKGGHIADEVNDWASNQRPVRR